MGWDTAQGVGNEEIAEQGREVGLWVVGGHLIAYYWEGVKGKETMMKIWTEVDDSKPVEEQEVDGRNHFAWIATMGVVETVVMLADQVVN